MIRLGAGNAACEVEPLKRNLEYFLLNDLPLLAFKLEFLFAIPRLFISIFDEFYVSDDLQLNDKTKIMTS